MGALKCGTSRCTTRHTKSPWHVCMNDPNDTTSSGGPWSNLLPPQLPRKPPPPPPPPRPPRNPPPLPPPPPLPRHITSNSKRVETITLSPPVTSALSRHLHRLLPLLTPLLCTSSLSSSCCTPLTALLANLPAMPSPNRQQCLDLHPLTATRMSTNPRGASAEGPGSLP